MKKLFILFFMLIVHILIHGITYAQTSESSDSISGCDLSISYAPCDCTPVHYVFSTNPVIDTLSADIFWYFGDGSYSYSPEPAHEYDNPGDYTVCVTLTKGDSSFCMTCVTDYFEGNESQSTDSLCDAEFEYYKPDSGSTEYDFMPLYPDNVSSFTWNFGDGTQSNEENPMRIFEDSSVYEVCLTVESDQCIDTYCTEIEVNIEQPECEADFSYQVAKCSGSLKCPGVYEFIDISSSNANIRIWNFGDGTIYNTKDSITTHEYSDTAIYNVCLTIITTDGREATRCKSLNYGEETNDCQADFSYESEIDSVPAIYFFSDNSTGGVIEWLWDFGDGTTSTEASPVHVYEDSIYSDVCLTIIASDGCESTECKVIGSTDTIVDCEADFSAYYREDVYCLNCMQFEDNSQGNVTEWLWEFSDGGTSDERNPLYQFDDSIWTLLPVTYSARLTIVTADGCISSVEKIVPTEETETCEANFDFVSVDIVNLYTYQFVDASVGDIETWYWTFGDTEYSYEPDPIHYYTESGKYEVCLEIITSDSCISETCQTIYVGDPVSCNAGFTYEILSDSSASNTVSFYDNSYSENDIVSWYWYFGDGSYSEETNPTHEYSSSGVYEVSLTIKTEDRSDTYQETINIKSDHATTDCNNYISLSIIDVTGKSFCDGVAIATLKNSSSEIVSADYTWSTGAASQAITGLCANTEYMVTAVDENNCESSTSFVLYCSDEDSLDVADYWLWELIDSQLSLYVSEETENYIYQWLLGDGTELTGTTISYSYSESGTYTIELQVTDSIGNIVFSDSVEIEVKSTTASVEEISQSIELKTYPNPVEDILNLDINAEENSETTISIINCVGQVIYTRSHALISGEQQIKIDTRSFKNGIYFIKFTTDKQNIYTVKFVKQ